MTGFKRILALAMLLILAAGSPLFAKDVQNLNPEQALKLLTVGNERFVKSQSTHPNASMSRRLMTATNGQVPFATVLACSDSRVPVEILFDQGIGDLFVIKVAGNVADIDEIGSAEYGVDHLGTPLLLVLGHSQCGAVTAVIKGAEVHGSIPKLVDNILPAAEKVKKDHPNVSTDELVSACITQNVWQAIEDILIKSPAIAERAKQGKVSVVGGNYDILTGKVTILGPHPQEKALLGGADAHSKDAKTAKAESHAPEAAAHEAPKSSGGGFGFGGFLIFVVLLIGVVIALDKTILNPDKQ